MNPLVIFGISKNQISIEIELAHEVIWQMPPGNHTASSLAVVLISAIATKVLDL